MRVYMLDADGDSFRGIYLAGDDDWLDFTSRFNGTPMKDSWTGKELFKFVPRYLPKGDTPSFDATIPVFNIRAAQVLADLLEPNGELLPIRCQGEDFFLFNVTRVVDALDEENCKLERLDDGRILDIKRYSFFEQKLVGGTVFKLRPDPLGWVYATDPFVERVKAAGLRGFDFPLVWSSD